MLLKSLFARVEPEPVKVEPAAPVIPGPGQVWIERPDADRRSRRPRLCALIFEVTETRVRWSSDSGVDGDDPLDVFLEEFEPFA